MTKIFTLKITRPDESETESMWKIFQAADLVQNRWSHGSTLKDFARRLRDRELTRDERRFILRAWASLVDGVGGFGRLMSSFEEYKGHFQDLDVDYVKAKPELEQMAADAALLPVFEAAYREAFQAQEEKERQLCGNAAEYEMAGLDLIRRAEAAEQRVNALERIIKSGLWLDCPLSPLAIADVMTERQRQVSEKGYTSESDDSYLPGILCLAGAAYAVAASASPDARRRANRLWPWPNAPKHFAPAGKSNPRANLVKAAALIIAEIERLDRSAEKFKEIS